MFSLYVNMGPGVNVSLHVNIGPGINVSLHVNMGPGVNVSLHVNMGPGVNVQFIDCMYYIHARWLPRVDKHSFTGEKFSFIMGMM